MLGMNRQLVATLFLVGVAIIITDRNINDKLRASLLTFFLIGVAVSHYGLTFIVMLSLLGTLILVTLVLAVFKQNKPELTNSWMLKHPRSLMISLLTVILFTYSWYVTVAGGVILDEYRPIFEVLIRAISDIAGQISNMAIISIDNPIKYFDISPYISQFHIICISLGLVILLTVKKTRIINIDYLLLSLPLFILFLLGNKILGGNIVIDKSRFVFITFTILVLFEATSLGFIEQKLGKMFKRKVNNPKQVIMVILSVIILLSSSGVISVIADSPSTTFIAPWEKVRPSFEYSEVRAEKWMLSHTGTYLNTSKDSYHNLGGFIQCISGICITRCFSHHKGKFYRDY
jgi:uncharacterized membrane protein